MRTQETHRKRDRKRERQTKRQRRKKRKLQKLKVRKDVLKLTTIHCTGRMDAAPQHTARLLPWRLAPRATVGRQWLYCHECVC